MAGNQFNRAAEIETLSNTFGFKNLLTETSRHPQTAILLDGCITSFIEYFGDSADYGNAVVTADDLSSIPLGFNNNGDFIDLQGEDADWVALYFPTSKAARGTAFYDVPLQQSLRELTSSKRYDRSPTYMRYLN